jgi:hypothetical protein
VFGALGTDPTSVTPFVNADQLLFAKSCPPEADHILIVSSSMQGTLLPYLMTLLQPAKEIGNQYRKNIMGDAFGWEWRRSNNLKRHTAGTIASTLTVHGGGQTGSSLVVTGTAADTIKKGDAFQIANVNFVNPMSRENPGAPTLQWFVATNDFTLTGGNDTITSPRLSSVLVRSTRTWTRSRPMVLPSPCGREPLRLVRRAAPRRSDSPRTSHLRWSARPSRSPRRSNSCTVTKDPDTGLSVRFVRAWDPRTSTLINRYDMCIGFGNLYPDNGAVRIVGA